MLWYKAWLETRARFLISLAAISAICWLRVFNLIHGSPHADYSAYVMHSAHELLTVAWLMATILLAMGGLLQERLAGVSSFTLNMPATRTRMAGIRAALCFLESVALIVVPWAIMFATATLTGRPVSFLLVVFYAVRLAAGGAVFAGTALLVASLVEGTYAAPMVSFGILIGCASAPSSLHSVNPAAFIGGAPDMLPGNVFSGTIPWAGAAVYLGVAAFLVLASVKVIERRDL